jgi:DNA polymerase III delta subunit
LRVFNKDFSLSKKTVLTKLKTANLEGNGYKKEEIIKLISEPGSIQPIYSKVFLFTKTVTCDKAMTIQQELDTLLGGKYKNDILSHRLRKLSFRKTLFNSVNDPFHVYGGHFQK